MNKLNRLIKLKSLMKLKEQEILIEFKVSQQNSIDIQNQITDLMEHRNASNSSLMKNQVTMNELNVARTFSQKVELALEQLSVSLEKSEEYYFKISEKLKDAKKRLKSIDRLIEKEQLIYNYDQEGKRQRQVEENLNFTATVSDL